MTNMPLLFAALPFLSAVSTVPLLYKMWPNRNTPTGGPLLWLLCAVGSWSFLYTFEVLATTLPTKLLFYNLETVAAVCAAPAWCVVALRWAEPILVIDSRRIAIFMIVPLFVVAMAFTNEWHYFYLRSVSLEQGSVAQLDIVYGPFYWLYSVYAFTLICAGSYSLLRRAMVSPQIHLPQAIIMILAILPPWLANAVFMAQWSPIGNFDLTPIATLLSTVCLYYGVARLKLTHSVPVAREQIFETIPQALFVIGKGGTLLDINRIGLELLDAEYDASIGRPATEVLRKLPEVAELVSLPDGTSRRLTLHNAIYSAEVNTVSGRITQFRVILCRDVSAEEHAAKLLRLSEDRLVFALSSSQIGAWDLDLADHSAFRTIEHDQIFGYEELLPEWTYNKFLEHVLPEDRAGVDKTFQKAIQEVGDWSFETRIVRTDGEQRWIWAHGRHSMPDENGHVRMAGVVQDITERKRQEELLRERESRLRLITENISEVFWIADPDNKTKYYISPAYEKIWGRTIESLYEKPRSFIDAIHEDDRDRVVADLAVMSEGHDIASEFRILLPDGEIRWIWDRGFPVRDTAGQVTQCVGIAKDITERKLAEIALRNSEETLRAKSDELERTFSISADIIAVVDEDGIFLKLSPAWERVLGWPTESAIGRPFRDFLHPDDLEKTERNIASLIHEGWSDNFSNRCRHANGSYRMLDWTVRVGEDGRRYASARDITEKALTLEALKQSEARFRGIIEATPLPMALNDEQQHIIYLNPAFVETFGYTLEDIPTLADWWPKAYPDPKYREAVASAWRTELERARNTDSNFRPNELNIQSKDGTRKIVMASAASFSDAFQGSHLVLLYDITERKRIEEETRQLNVALTHFKRTLDQTLDCVYIYRGGDFRFTYVNAGATRQVGYSEAEMLTMSPLDIKPEFTPEQFKQFVQPLIDGTKSSIAFETIHRHKDGHDIPVEVTLQYIAQTEAEPCFITVVRDTSERKASEKEREQLQLQLAQSQKMESVGQLAGGIAHDFNNLLHVILGNLDLLSRANGTSLQKNSGLEEARMAAERAADLTRQLLAFSRREVIQRAILNLNELTDGVLKMIRRIIGEQVDLAFFPGEELATVSADKGQIEQILVNLCVNARDAMPSGGTLIIQTKNVVLDDAYCSEHADSTIGPYVLLSVTDTGIGMDEATRAQIFEPFFTTKDVGKGVGLGLAMVYGLVKQHGGYINVESEPGKGTAITIYLPISEGTAQAAVTKQQQDVSGGTETILLAEDEAMVRNILTVVLEDAGYTVRVACDGQDALRVFEEHGGAFDLLLLDVMMPKLNGYAVRDDIRVKYPHMRFLFSSGYGENIRPTDFILKEGLRLIRKPYKPEELLQAVREVLDAPLIA